MQVIFPIFVVVLYLSIYLLRTPYDIPWLYPPSSGFRPVFWTDRTYTGRPCTFSAVRQLLKLGNLWYM